MTYSPLAARFVPSPSVEVWPRQKPIRAVVIHMAEGGGTASWLTRPDGNSSHYVVEYSGSIVAMIHEEKAAGSINPRLIRLDDDAPFTYLGDTIIYGRTAARAALGDAASNPNTAVIAIEVEGFAGANTGSLSDRLGGPNDKQAAALKALLADIFKRRGKMPVLGHRDFQKYKACPGRRIPWLDYGGHAPANAQPPEVIVEGLHIIDEVPAVGFARVKAGLNGVQAVQIADQDRFNVAAGDGKPALSYGKLMGDPLGKDADYGGMDRHSVYRLGGPGVESAVLLAVQVDLEVPTATKPVVELRVPKSVTAKVTEV